MTSISDIMKTRYDSSFSFLFPLGTGDGRLSNGRCGTSALSNILDGSRYPVVSERSDQRQGNWKLNSMSTDGVSHSIIRSWHLHHLSSCCVASRGLGDASSASYLTNNCWTSAAAGQPPAIRQCRHVTADSCSAFEQFVDIKPHRVILDIRRVPCPRT